MDSRWLLFKDDPAMALKFYETMRYYGTLQLCMWMTFLIASVVIAGVTVMRVYRPK